jgi:hypothetical protein
MLSRRKSVSKVKILSSADDDDDDDDDDGSEWTY